MVGVDGGGAERGGCAGLGYWGSRAQVAAGESGSAGGGGEGNEVNLKSQPPLLFIKVLGSR